MLALSRCCRIVTFLVTLLLGVVCITSPAKADGLPQFSASATSGSAGSLVSVTQVDPCPDQLPSPAPGQYVEFTFTDAAGVKTRSHSSLTVDTGDWIGSPNLYIPSKHISNIDTSRTWADAATGVGSFTVRCFSGSQTTRAYQPKPFIVTGPSPGFRLSSAKIQLEETIQISSADACPLSMPYGHVAIASSEAGVSADMVFDSASGGWHANIKIPKVVTDAMGTSRSFSLGRAVVSASCFNQDGHAVNYGHTLLEVVAAATRMAALGDSYSSGVGTFKYRDAKNSCLRSELGYPLYVAKKLNLGEPAFAACSGAVTDDFYKANPKNANEPAQLSQLTKDTEVVTLTIGGNDAGFEYVLDKCVQGLRGEPHPLPFGWGCSKDKQLQRYVDTRLDALAGKTNPVLDRPVHSLLSLYGDIHKAAPRAKIYIGGYPRLFGQDKEMYTDWKGAPSKRVCPVVNRIYSVDYKDARWINQQADLLNSVIRKQVAMAVKEGIPITYIDPLFGGHGLCDKSEPWINKLVPSGQTVSPESFHPTSTGYSLGYSLGFAAAIRRG